MRRIRMGRIARRLIPNIRVGTENYPEKIARRLRAFNIAVWIAAMVPGTMAFVRFFDGKLAVGIADVFVATIYASMPLLHRFGPLVAPIAFASVSYAVIFWVNSLVGTNGGTSLGYFTATALSILIIGTEHYLIGAAIGIISIALAIITELVLPRDSGFVSSTFLIVTNYALSVASTSTILYGIIFYAVRQMERAEAIAEREYRRSEVLLTNILPPSIAATLKALLRRSPTPIRRPQSFLLIWPVSLRVRATPHQKTSSISSTVCTPG
jgi:adenylate cyclase